MVIENYKGFDIKFSDIKPTVSWCDCVLKVVIKNRKFTTETDSKNVPYFKQSIRALKNNVDMELDKNN